MYTYIIKSNITNKYYIGSTQNIEERLSQHNAGLTRSTKHGIPWKIIYYEVCLTKSESLKKEKLWKSYKGGNAFKKLLGSVA